MDWRPRGYRDAAEARLERFGPAVTSLPAIWEELASWWLSHRAGANTPNWDIAMNCAIEGCPGLLLVEAKANERELSHAGKRMSDDATLNSLANHDRIASAIAEANEALRRTHPTINLSIASHYQLANRIAFAWKLANLGIPTIVMYIGFTGDGGIVDAGVPFRGHEHWTTHFNGHLESVAPLAMLDRRIECGDSAFWLISRSRSVIQQSPRLQRPN